MQNLSAYLLQLILTTYFHYKTLQTKYPLSSKGEKTAKAIYDYRYFFCYQMT